MGKPSSVHSGGGFFFMYKPYIVKQMLIYFVILKILCNLASSLTIKTYYYDNHANFRESFNW